MNEAMNGRLRLNLFSFRGLFVLVIKERSFSTLNPIAREKKQKERRRNETGPAPIMQKQNPTLRLIPNVAADSLVIPCRSNSL